MLCGIPGSGKSTVAAELVRRLGDVEVIATDVIGGRVGRYTKLRRQLDGLAGRRRFVVLDGTFFSRDVRDEVRKMGYPVLLTYLKCPLAVCLERNEARRAAISIKGVIGMQRRFEPPGEDERPLVIQTDRTDPEAAARRIYRAVVRTQAAGARGADSGDSKGSEQQGGTAEDGSNSGGDG
jgi:predicted kinase